MTARATSRRKGFLILWVMLTTAGAWVWLKYLDSTPAYTAGAGAYSVRRLDRVLTDDRRGREVPVRIHVPAGRPSGDERFPVVVFSHGLAASGNNYAYFARGLAERGYVVIAPTHHGSDTQAFKEWAASRPRPGRYSPAALKQWFQETVNDSGNLSNRPLDVSFILDQISRIAAISRVADGGRAGVAGHSFGAYTAMAAGGMAVDTFGQKARSFRDERIKAVFAMSPQGPGTMGITAGSWDGFRLPVMLMTGTRDFGAGHHPPRWRRAAFDEIRQADRYLITLKGAGHFTFGGTAESAERPRPPAGPIGRLVRPLQDRKEAALVETIRSLSAAFFDSYLLETPEATRYLQDYVRAGHPEALAEFRPARPTQ